MNVFSSLRTRLKTLNLLTATLFLVTAMFNTGCLLNKNTCSEDFSKTIIINDIDGNHLNIPISELDFLTDPKLVLSDVELRVTTAGKKKPTKEYVISINGIKVLRHDKNHHAENDDDEYRNCKDSKSRFKLHKFSLNGSQSFENFLIKLRKNKGQLRIFVDKHGSKIIEASIVFKGKRFVNCPPPPPPPPPPVDVKTQIDSAVPAQSQTASTNILFNFSSNVSGSTQRCSLDGAAFTQCASPKSYSGLASGSHTFRVYSVTPAGQSEATPVSYSWIVDAEAPSVTITNLGSLLSLTKANSISISFISNDSSAQFLCSLDGAAAVSCTSPNIYSGLSEGLHNFSVTAVDSLGNINSNPATFQWTVDLTPPIASISNTNPAGAINNVANKELTFVANEAASFECSVDAQAFTACASPLSLNGLSDGTHWFEVRAIDLAGNQGVVASFSWKIDTIAPVLSAGAISPAQGLTNANHISTEFSADEISTFFCSFDSEAATECQSPYSRSSISEGNHSLSIYAMDNAGNKSNILSFNWNMDLTAPLISFGEILPSAASVINSQDIVLPVNLNKAAALNVTLNGVLQSQNSSPISFNNLSEGIYQVAIFARDSAGNVSNTIQHNFRVDVTAPILSMAAARTASPINFDNNSFTFSTNEDSIFYCNMDGMGFELCSSPKDVSGLADGSHAFEVRAVDLAGNESSISSYSWEIDTIAPVTSLSANQFENKNITFTLSASENNVSYKCSLDGAPASACTSPVTYNNLSAGSHTFTAQATDIAGNIDSAGATHNFIVLEPVAARIVSVSPAKDPTNQNTMSISFAANRGPASFICSLDGAAATPCTSPILYTSIPNGPHSFRVQAIDEYNNIEPVGASFGWTVDTVRPLIVSLSTASSSTSITITWETSEPTSARVLYGQGSNINQSTPEFLTLTMSHSVEITGLMPATQYSFIVTGRDSAGNSYTSNSFTAFTSGGAF